MPLAAGGMVCGPHNVGHGYRYRVWWWCTGLITQVFPGGNQFSRFLFHFLTRSPLVPLSCGRGIRPSEEEIGGFPLYFFSACGSVAPFAGHWGLSPCPHIQKCAHTPPCIALLWEKLVNGGDNPARYTHLWIFSRHIFLIPPCFFQRRFQPLVGPGRHCKRATHRSPADLCAFGLITPGYSDFEEGPRQEHMCLVE